jgi:thioredoxin 1
MKVEVLHSGGCAKCRTELPALHAAALSVDADIDWHELDILQAIDYAVELGVLKPPAVAIDGQLVFKTLPSVKALTTALRERVGS